MKINRNTTGIADDKIIAALEEARKRGKYATLDTYRTDTYLAPWEQVRYVQHIEVPTGKMIETETEIYEETVEVVCRWHPTEEGWKMSEGCDDESYTCDWDEVAEVELM